MSRIWCFISAQEALQNLFLRFLRRQAERLELEQLLARDTADGRLMDEARVDVVAGDLRNGAHLCRAHDDRVAGDMAEARAVALRSPFPAGNQGLFCIGNVSTRYKDRDASLAIVEESLATMVRARCGNYLAFFPSYAYMEQAYAQFKEHCPEINCIKQENAMDEQQKAAFLAQFVPGPSQTLLGFAVMGGVFGEGVDLTGDRLIGVGIVGPGLPQVGPRQEQLRDYFEQTRGSGFDYAYRYPGMNKVLQAAGRVIRTPRDKGVVLLIDNRFAMPDYRRLMPPHWSHLKIIYDTEELERELWRFWEE